ncbi:MAG: hypothetical protein ACRD3A_11825 [Terriglobales bacterium]
MTLFEAPAYDPRRARRKKELLAAGLLSLVLVGLLTYRFWNWREERAVDQFFSRLEQKDYEGAYAIWLADPGWRQHPQKYERYPYGDFYRDWGPGGEWGLIKSHQIETAVRPPQGGSGVIVVVTINQRAQKAFIWVEKGDLSLTFSPYEVELR